MKDTEEIKKWLKSQHHLPSLPDDLIMLFLHSREHHLEETKRAIDLFCTIKTQAPEFFTRRDPLSQEIQYIQHVIKICLLPRKTLDDYRMIFVRPHDYDPSHFFLNPAIKLLFMVLDVSLKEDGLATRGLILIFDMKGVVLGHISRIILTSVKKYFLYEQDAIPVKLKAIHVINVNPVMSHIMNIIKPFIRKEHMKKLHLHSGGADFLKGWLPTENLPGDYGGVEEDFLTLHEHTMKRLEIYREWFEEEEKLKVDESKRPTDGTNFSGNIFGAEGSFKKLDID